MINTHCTHPSVCHYQVVLSPDRADEFQEAPQALVDVVDVVDVVDRIGGYMTPEDQRVLWRARVMSRGGR
jgi:hypothetical protein